MPLKEGDKAPDFLLRDVNGVEHHLFSQKGYKLVVFYKVTCPTCQLTLPFIEKMFRSYGEGVKFFGVSQDSADDTRRFSEDYGLTFTQLIDYPEYEVSLKYDINVVPTIYLIDPEGRVVFSEEGFVKSSMERLNVDIAGASGSEINPIFEDVSVPAFKAG